MTAKPGGFIPSVFVLEIASLISEMVSWAIRYQRLNLDPTWKGNLDNNNSLKSSDFIQISV
jgi:hypothetical protein